MAYLFVYTTLFVLLLMYTSVYYIAKLHLDCIGSQLC